MDGTKLLTELRIAGLPATEIKEWNEDNSFSLHFEITWVGGGKTVLKMTAREYNAIVYQHGYQYLVKAIEKDYHAKAAKAKAEKQRAEALQRLWKNHKCYRRIRYGKKVLSMQYRNMCRLERLSSNRSTLARILQAITRQAKA